MTSTIIAPEQSDAAVAPRRRPSRRVDHAEFIPRLLVMVMIAVFYVSPLATLVIGSLEKAGTLPSFAPSALQQMSLSNYVSFFRSDGLASIGTSLLIAVGVTGVLLLVGIPGAYWLSRTAPRFGPWILIVLIFLQMVPEASIVIPLYPVLASWGLLSSVAGVILPSAAMLLPFAVLLLQPYFQGVPRELSEAAAIDGAGPFSTFARVVLPLASNGIVTVGILTFMISWGQFVFAVSFLNDPTLYPAPALLTTYLGQFDVDWPGLMAASVATSLPIIVLFLAFQRRLSAGLSAGAVKG